MYLRVLQILGAEISARYAAGGFVRSGAGLGYLAGCNGGNFASAGAEAESEGGRVCSKNRRALPVRRAARGGKIQMPRNRLSARARKIARTRL